MAFEDGMRAGADAYNNYQNQQRQARLDAMTAQEHGLRMQSAELALNQQRGINNAQTRIQGLVGKNGFSDDQAAAMAERYGMTPGQIQAPGAQISGFGIPYAPDDEAMQAPRQDTGIMQRRNMNQALMGLAAAKGDTVGLTAGQLEGRKINVDEHMKGALARINDPAFREELARNVNNNNPYLTVNEEVRDKKTGKVTTPASITVVDEAGKGKVIPLTEDAYRQLAHAHVLTQEGFHDEAHQRVGGVNAEIQSAVQRANELQGKRFDGNVKSRAEADRNNYQLGELEQSRLRTQAMAEHYKATTPREVSQATLDKLVKLEQDFIQEKDPTKKATLQQQYRMVLSQAGAEVRKPMGLPTDRSEMSQKDKLDVYAKLLQAGEKPEDAWAKASGDDPFARMTEVLEAKYGKKPPPPAPGPAAPPMPPPRRKTIDEHLQETLAENKAEEEAAARRAVLRATMPPRQLGLPAVPAWSLPQYNRP